MKLLTYLEKRYLVEKSLRPSSEYQLRRALGAFQEFIGHEATTADLDDNKVSLWLKALEETHAAKTIHRMRGDLLSLWRSIAHERGSVNVLPPYRVRNIRVPRTHPEAWPKSTILKLLSACKRLPERRSDGGPLGPYFAALISAAWDTGLRKTDLFLLDMRTIRPGGYLAVIQEKTANVIRVRLRGTTLELLRAIKSPTPLAWTSTKRLFYYWFEKLKKLAGVTTGGYMQRIRRSAATNVELIAPGLAGHFLGHLTPGLAYKHYVDRNIARPEVVQPEPLAEGGNA